MLEILIGKWVVLMNSKEKNLKSLLLFFVFLPFVSFSQEDCKELKFGWNKIKVCDLHQFKKLDIDSIAKAHLMINDRMYMATVPSDSMLKAHVFYSQFLQLGENSVVISSFRQSKNTRLIGIVNPDYSTQIIMYKNGIRNGIYYKFVNRTIIAEKGRYKKGMKKSSWKFWDEKGNLTELKKYKKGEEIENFTGNKLKSLKIIRFGPTIKYGAQMMEVKNLNQALSSNNPVYERVPELHFMLNNGFELGNPSSLTIAAYQRLISANSGSSFKVSASGYGGKLNYTFLQTKKQNFRIGAGVETIKTGYKNTLNATYTSNEYLLQPVIKSNPSLILDFSFQLMSRKIPFYKKTNADLFFSGLEIGYSLPVKAGEFIDINNNTLTFSHSPFSFQGFHFSLFIFVPTF